MDTDHFTEADRGSQLDSEISRKIKIHTHILKYSLPMLKYLEHMANQGVAF
jgi:hypothetical protein